MSDVQARQAQKGAAGKGRGLVWLLVAVAAGLLAFLPQPFPQHLTKYDFRAYWGASYLLARGEAFADPARLFALQQELTGWLEGAAQMTWNPPWVLVWFIPLSWMSFDRASWIWFLISFTMIFASLVMLWQVYWGEERHRHVWIPLLVALLFVPTLTTLLVGQITAIVLVGLAGVLFFMERERPYAAGLFLSLTTAKPHLLFITLPLLVLALLRRRRWKVLATFAGFPLAGLVVAFVLRPTLLSEYLSTLAAGGRLEIPIPTVTNFLAGSLGWPALRFAGLALLPVMGFIWWRRAQRGGWPLPDLVSVTLVLSLATSFYGWSFDVLMYLLPIVQCTVWILKNRERRVQSLVVIASFALVDLLAWYQRIVGGRDDQYWWIPGALALIYFWCRLQLHAAPDGAVTEAGRAAPETAGA